MPRKSISKKTRFEVFKRDSFTCQYCGSKAPDVILQIDHIKPISKGGKDTLLNYITSCHSCNSGKSDRLLSDKSVVERQRQQLADLQERKEQIEMMLDWHNGLKDLKDFQIQKVLEYFNKVNACDINLTKFGLDIMNKRLKKYGIQKLITAIDVLAEKYASLCIEERFNKLNGVLYYLDADAIEKNVMYVNGICRNRFNYHDPSKCKSIIRSVLELGYTFELTKQIAADAKNWSDWRDQMKDLLNFNNNT